MLESWTGWTVCFFWYIAWVPNLLYFFSNLLPSFPNTIYFLKSLFTIWFGMQSSLCMKFPYTFIQVYRTFYCVSLVGLFMSQFYTFNYWCIHSMFKYLRRIVTLLLFIRILQTVPLHLLFSCELYNWLT